MEAITLMTALFLSESHGPQLHKANWMQPLVMLLITLMPFPPLQQMCHEKDVLHEIYEIICLICKNIHYFVLSEQFHLNKQNSVLHLMDLYVLIFATQRVHLCLPAYFLT